MSILEALACSLPAIITDTCNFEAVQHYNAGIVCKTTEDSISKALERAKNIAESDHAKQRIQARTLVKENFEESLILDQYKTLYT